MPQPALFTQITADGWRGESLQVTSGVIISNECSSFNLFTPHLHCALIPVFKTWKNLSRGWRPPSRFFTGDAATRDFIAREMRTRRKHDHWNETVSLPGALYTNLRCGSQQSTSDSSFMFVLSFVLAVPVLTLAERPIYEAQLQRVAAACDSLYSSLRHKSRRANQTSQYVPGLINTKRLCAWGNSSDSRATVAPRCCAM